MQARTLAAWAVSGLASLTSLPTRADPVTVIALGDEPVSLGSTVTIAAYFSQPLLDLGEILPGDPEPQPEANVAQRWLTGLLNYSSESLTAITFTLTRPGAVPLVGIADPGTAGPGNVHSATWFFEVGLAHPGVNTLSVTTVWTTSTMVQSVGAVSLRTCDGAAVCTGWEETFEPYPAAYIVREYTAGPIALQVQAVPEPAVVALWLLGLGVLVARLRRGAG